MLLVKLVQANSTALILCQLLHKFTELRAKAYFATAMFELTAHLVMGNRDFQEALCMIRVGS